MCSSACQTGSRWLEAGLNPSACLDFSRARRYFYWVSGGYISCQGNVGRNFYRDLDLAAGAASDSLWDTVVSYGKCASPLDGCDQAASAHSAAAAATRTPDRCASLLLPARRTALFAGLFRAASGCVVAARGIALQRRRLDRHGRVPACADSKWQRVSARGLLSKFEHMPRAALFTPALQVGLLDAQRQHAL